MQFKHIERKRSLAEKSTFTTKLRRQKGQTLISRAFGPHAARVERQADPGHPARGDLTENTGTEEEQVVKGRWVVLFELGKSRVTNTQECQFCCSASSLNSGF